MVSIPERSDPTIDAVNSALESSQEPRASKNIGFGVIGHECSRYIWYKINTDDAEVFNSDTLRLFRNGHKDEELMAEDLSRVDGITLWTKDPDRGGKQYKFDSLEGRLTGRLDGVILGLKQAPSVPHVWEHKSVNEKKFKELVKLKQEDQKTAFEKWDIVYYAQAQSCMLHADIDRHYLTVGTPGLRQVIGVRTEINKKYAKSLVDKAARIINSKEPLEKIGGPDWYKCKYCRFHSICHGN